MSFSPSELPRKIKILIMILCDIFLLPFAFWSAIALRLGTFSPDVSSFHWLFLAIPFVTVPVFMRFGLYRAVIRYINDKEIYTVFYGVTISVLALAVVVIMLQITSVPRSSLFIYWVIAVIYIVVSRFAARGLLRQLESGDRKERVAIYGAGSAGLQTALALISGKEYKPVVFFDDNPELLGSSVAGIRIHSPKDALRVMDSKGCRQLLLAIPSLSRTRRREIVQQFEGEGVVIKTLPGLGELLEGKVRLEDIRQVGVEDLLGRDPVPPFANLISSCVEDKVVLISGAGGSIGSELCRQILKYRPKKIILFELSEYSLYKIHQELSRDFPHADILPLLGSVSNESQLESIFKTYQVQTVYHAAAYKHVPLVETNLLAGVMNNVLGTLAAAKAAQKASVQNFVLISTDKAVRPTNVMGATKRLAELVLQALAEESDQKTIFCMVRFGNVLGSSGSVVPLFREQIKYGGPVTVTDPRVTRYFMTIPEAAQLVIQAGAMGTGGEVFVLDMGEPIRIVDLAKKMIELSGLEMRDEHTGVGDISIQYVGLRPGEKLYEELLIGSNVSTTSHPRILRAEEDSLEPGYLWNELSQVRQMCQNGDDLAVKAKLKVLVKEYLSATEDVR